MIAPACQKTGIACERQAGFEGNAEVEGPEPGRRLAKSGFSKARVFTHSVGAVYFGSGEGEGRVISGTGGEEGRETGDPTCRCVGKKIWLALEKRGAIKGESGGG